MRRVQPLHKSWDACAHGYQKRAVQFLCERGSAGLFLDPGLGKTSTTLSAFKALQDEGVASTMLVIAPLRVCQLVWRQEALKWTEFKDLKIELLHGDKKKEALKRQADIYLINPEGVAWLCDTHFGGRLPFDVLCIDELTKFKNPRAQRSKKLHPFADKMARRWGLTGTPAPNGYMDLFGQMRMLDGGAALGKYVTHFRDRYFQAGRDGFSYDLIPGADKQIEAALEPYVMYASAEDYLSLPPLIEHVIELELDKPTRALYKQMKRDMLAQVDGAVITAANAAATYSKLKQMANGAVYTISPEYKTLHTVKLDALDDLIEELSGQQLLVAYEFQHDLARLLERYPNTPYLGGGVSGKRAAEIEAAWNAGETKMLFCHPASAGHGLNMQLGGAGHLCWFSQTWDYELYDQFIRRIHRQGTTATRIVNHKLIVKDTIDEEVDAALQGKETTQDRLLAALKSEIVRDDPKVNVEQGNQDMRRLTSPGGAAPQVQSAAAAPAPGGWGGATAAPASDQRQDIGAKIGGGAPASGWNAPAETQAIQTGGERVDPAQGGLQHFSPQVQQAVAQPDQSWAPPAVSHENVGTEATRPDNADKTARKRRTKAEIEADEQQALREKALAMAATMGVPTAPGAAVEGTARAFDDYHLTFDVSVFLAAALNAGSSLDAASTAAADVIDYLRGKSEG